MRPTRPFAAIVQAVLVVLMLFSFLLIGQQVSKGVYHAGLLLLIAASLVQNAFGNISPDARFGQSMKSFALIMLVMAGIFLLGILLVPYLVQMGQG